jgi:hypothetical protein
VYNDLHFSCNPHTLNGRCNKYEADCYNTLGTHVETFQLKSEIRLERDVSTKQVEFPAILWPRMLGLSTVSFGNIVF